METIRFHQRGLFYPAIGAPIRPVPPAASPVRRPSAHHPARTTSKCATGGLSRQCGTPRLSGPMHARTTGLVPLAACPPVRNVGRSCCFALAGQRRAGGGASRLWHVLGWSRNGALKRTLRKPPVGHFNLVCRTAPRPPSFPRTEPSKNLAASRRGDSARGTQNPPEGSSVRYRAFSEAVSARVRPTTWSVEVFGGFRTRESIFGLDTRSQRDGDARPGLPDDRDLD